MFRYTTTGLATLVWMERGQIPTEASFQTSLVPSHLSRHVDVQAAVREAMRRLAGGSSGGLQPWVLSQGIILEPDELQLIHNHSIDPMDACTRY